MVFFLYFAKSCLTPIPTLVKKPFLSPPVTLYLYVEAFSVQTWTNYLTCLSLFCHQKKFHRLGFPESKLLHDYCADLLGNALGIITCEREGKNRAEGEVELQHSLNGIPQLIQVVLEMGMIHQNYPELK